MLGEVDDYGYTARDRRILAVMAAVIVLVFVAGFVASINVSSYRYATAGDTYEYRLAQLPPKPAAGRTAYVLSLGRFTPDQGISISFDPGYPLPGYDINVQVVSSTEGILFAQTRNTAAYANVFPERAGNLTLVLTPYCQECSSTSDAMGFYTYYTRTPFFEHKVAVFFVGATVMAATLEGAYLYVRARFTLKRLICYAGAMAMVLAILFVEWYWYAYDLEQWYIPGVFLLAGMVIGQLFVYLFSKGRI